MGINLHLLKPRTQGGIGIGIVYLRWKGLSCIVYLLYAGHKQDVQYFCHLKFTAYMYMTNQTPFCFYSTEILIYENLK